ncbi:hypothetical protein NQ318_010435 [Aromia moschata]|uniref:Uncharacterized protein n=1 Tax=Aromia moschata TaxID=1265417 RepID=A0AAV8Y4G0_9CUCU|nr:hypothetical protein NQ318_010435 [Aromia moschata]
MSEVSTFHLNKTLKDTYGMFKDAFVDVCISYTQAKKWHKSLREGREDVNDEARSGRPSTSRTDEHVTQVREFLNTDRRMSVRMISEQLNFPKTIVHEIVSEDMAMQKICAKLVTEVVTDAQKEHRVESKKYSNLLGLWREVEAIVGVDDRIFVPTSTDSNQNYSQ